MLTLYKTSQCPSCHAQEKILKQLQEDNPTIEFSSINLETSTTINISPPMRSVPTLFINEYRFEGLMTADQILQWLGPENHNKEYINELLKSGQLQQAFDWLHQHPLALSCVAELLSDNSIEMVVRIGLDALIELLAGSGELQNITQPLGKLLDTVPESLCIDILHYLAMIGTADAYAYVTTCTAHPHTEVQRAARELLQERDDMHQIEQK